MKYEADTKGSGNLFVDRSSNHKGTGVSVILESPEGDVLERVVRLGFQASNNEAEYEAQLAGVKLAADLNITKLRIFSDSQLVVNQILREYLVRDENMISYYEISKKEFGRIL